MKTHKKIAAVLCVVAAIPFVLAGCANAKGKEVALNGVVRQMKKSANFENGVLENLKQPETARLYGINPNDISEGYIYYEKDAKKPDRIILAQAKNTASLENLERAVSNEAVGLHTTFSKDEKQSRKLEENIIKTRGNYVLYAVTEKNKDIESIFNKNV